MKVATNRNGGLSTKLIASIGVVLCVVIGVVGIVIPLIPGLVFLAIAAVIASRHFPSMERRLRRSRTISRSLDNADRITRLTLWTKLELGSLICVKMLLDGVSLMFSMMPRLRRPTAERLRH
jgi:uncharacterized membrane protein YbaN (DUF454 family)